MSWLDGPLVFLDIDGVLNSEAYMRRRPQLPYSDGPRGLVRDMDSDAVRTLQRILDATGAGIVLSSTWRLLYPLETIRDMLGKAGLKAPVPLHDGTPELMTWKGTIVIPSMRGAEVDRWIVERRYVGKFVILDDDADFYAGQPLVRTSATVGLTEEDANRCIALLRG